MNDQNMMKKVVLLCLFTVFAVGYALSAGNDDVEKKIDQLLSKMTLEEKNRSDQPADRTGLQP